MLTGRIEPGRFIQRQGVEELTCRGLDGGSFGIVQAAKTEDGRTETRVRAEASLVLGKEVPVEDGECSSILAKPLFRIIATA
ncbi:hypothetical protein BH23CHL5_BH23CHL5_25540 [soil metagenome]